jgi:hypothetical protein
MWYNRRKKGRREGMQKGPKPAELTISKEERNALEELVRRHHTAQHLAKRGRMILGAADGKSNGDRPRAGNECGHGAEVAHAMAQRAGGGAGRSDGHATTQR